MEACTQEGQTHKQGHTQPEAWGERRGRFLNDSSPSESHLRHFNTSDPVRKGETCSACPGITAIIVASVS